MPTVTPVLRDYKSTLDSKGRAPLYLRVSDSDTTRFVSLGVRVHPRNWSASKRRVKKGDPNHEEINTLITKQLAAAQSEALQGKLEQAPRDAADIKRALLHDRCGKEDLFSFAEDVIADMIRKGMLHSGRRYRSASKKLAEFVGGPLEFDKVTPSLLRRYEGHLASECKNKSSTIASNLRAIRAILYRAHREGLASRAANPFAEFKIREAKSNRAKLSLDQIQRIADLDLDIGTLVWHVRNYWLFSFYAGGIRFSDLVRLLWKNVKEGRLEYQMGKTGRAKSVKLVEPALEILSHYGPRKARDFVFPILDGYNLSTEEEALRAISSQNALVNKYLKTLAEMADVADRLSFHVARHSFADLARTKGWSVYDISKALGHANIKVTENYLKSFDAERLDSQMEELFG